MPTWRALTAGIALFGLTGALIYFVVTNGGPSSQPVPTLVSAPTAVVTKAPVVVGVHDTTIATTVEAGSTTTTGPPPVIAAMRSALSAWGEFAVSGKLRDLGGHFVVGGPQRRKLREESEAISADPLGPPPYAVTTSDIFTVSVAPDDIVMRADVTWDREGEETQEYTWDIQMRRVDGVWQLYTVDEASAG